MILGSLLAMFYSRRREYRADEMAALLVGHNHMIDGLRTIGGDTEVAPVAQAQYAAFKISSAQSFAEWFSTHPTIDKRIEALRTRFETSNN